jgi:hypothetical protein
MFGCASKIKTNVSTEYVERFGFYYYKDLSDLSFLVQLLPKNARREESSGAFVALYDVTVTCG